MESSLPYDIPYLQRVYLFYYLLLHYNLVTIILISSSTSNLFRVHLFYCDINIIKIITTSCLWIKRVSWSFFGFVTSVMISISFSSWFNLFLPDELNSEETSVAESLGSSVYYYYYYVLQLWHLYFLDYHLFVQRIVYQHPYLILMTYFL